MSVRAVLDAMMPMLEPTETLRDDSRARPVVFDPETVQPTFVGDLGVLYGWPRRERFDPEGSGRLDLERFSIRLAWAVDASLELSGELRERSTSEVLFDKAEAIGAWVRTHRRGPDLPGGAATWEHVALVEVDYESLVTNSVRGIYLDLDGYTLLES